MDVMPTFLSLANADFDPTSVRGRDVLPMDGKSFQAALQEKPDHWRTWRLFNLADDPTEQHDLAAEEPEIFAELTTLWDQWAETNGVITDITPQWRQPRKTSIE